jgi:hypothetical protein
MVSRLNQFLSCALPVKAYNPAKIVEIGCASDVLICFVSHDTATRTQLSFNQGL